MRSLVGMALVQGILLPSRIEAEHYSTIHQQGCQQHVGPQQQQYGRQTTAHDSSYETLTPLHRSNRPVPVNITNHFNPEAEPNPILLDAYNPIHNYLQIFDSKSNHHPPVDFPELPLFHTWMHYPEAYHNHFDRYRGRERVVFMEVGVQSGGKIPLLRDYFGPGFVYVGIDINPSTKMFESADWVHIEIGDSADPTFWRDVIQPRYPVVDIFLDDGGHTMKQQKLALQEMLPHVQPDGVYLCEDLATSWSGKFGGKRGGTVRDLDFILTTMQGLVYQTMDWLHAGFVFGPGNGVAWDVGDVPGSTTNDGGFGSDWWQVVTQSVKHIHLYNQIVVYEKGQTFAPASVATVGKAIPYSDSGIHEPVDWEMVMKKVQSFTKSKWNW